ncbi:MAG: hypothetical protein IPN07_17040 [Dehalococcoidia bacterium]|nr:hypothetical protein [Dehalococcoidia bacterium]
MAVTLTPAAEKTPGSRGTTFANRTCPCSGAGEHFAARMRTRSNPAEEHGADEVTT